MEWEHSKKNCLKKRLDNPREEEGETLQHFQIVLVPLLIKMIMMWIFTVTTTLAVL